MCLTFRYLRLVRGVYRWWMALSFKQTAIWLGSALTLLTIAAIIHLLR